jgi:uncharacterized protein involved in type VI secretion and phage assembly
MHGMVHTIQRIARDEAAKAPAAALGVVTSVHGRDGGDADYACTVQLRESGLVLPKVPIATGLVGVAALPAEGDLVLVVFAGGDLHAPVVAGRLHSQSAPPPKNAPGELVAWLPGGEEAEDSSLQLTVRTPGDGTRKVTLLLGGDVEIRLEVDDQSITFQAGEAKLALTQSGGSDGKAELAVGDSSVVIEQSGNVTVKASGTLELKASQIKLSGDTSVKVAGQTIDLN